MDSSSTEEKNTLPIHLLPVDVIDIIAKFLSIKDMAACCAVSHDMREVFGDDVLWRRHCERDLAEYLRTTPCEFAPPFVSPEAKDNTLSPVGYWRMAYMRENHFWNNWRQRSQFFSRGLYLWRCYRPS